MPEDPTTPKSVKTTKSKMKDLVMQAKVKRDESKKDLDEANLANEESLQKPIPKIHPDKLEKNLDWNQEENQSPKINKQEYLEETKKHPPAHLKMSDEELKESVNQSQKMNVQVSAKKKELENNQALNKIDK